jgi:DNA sulfur modification protein DndD
MNQDGASVGQTLSVGYTFLTNLLHRGMHQFPLVVDSPANPLSIEVRREIGKLVPSLCKQFVGFTISSEREGFVSSMDTECLGGIKYMTLFRKGEGTAGLIEGLASFEHIQNETCALVYGKEYFCKFDIEKE